MHAQPIYLSHDFVNRNGSGRGQSKVNHKVKKGYPVFLGTDLKTFDENARNNPIKREDLNEFWIGYCGSMGDSYDLDIVIDAISIVNKSFKSNSDKKDQYKIKFVAIPNILDKLHAI